MGVAENMNSVLRTLTESNALTAHLSLPSRTRFSHPTKKQTPSLSRWTQPTNHRGQGTSGPVRLSRSSASTPAGPNR